MLQDAGLPTYHANARFFREFSKLTSEQQALFLEAVAKLIEDLNCGAFRKSLRIKRFQGTDNLWELTWAPNGRALFELGPEIKPGKPHVEWHRIGGHEIFDRKG